MIDPIRAKIIELVPELNERHDIDCPTCHGEGMNPAGKIQLDHVLRAIWENAKVRHGDARDNVVFGDDGEGELFWKQEYERYALGIIRKWNLALDYDNQDQPTKDLIGKIIGVTD